MPTRTSKFFVCAQFSFSKLLWLFDYFDLNGNVYHLRAFWRQGIMKTALKDTRCKKYFQFLPKKNVQNCNNKLHTWKSTTHKHAFFKSLCARTCTCACVHSRQQLVVHLFTPSSTNPVTNIMKYLVIYIHNKDECYLAIVCAFWPNFVPKHCSAREGGTITIQDIQETNSVYRLTPCWSVLVFWNIYLGIYFKLK